MHFSHTSQTLHPTDSSVTFRRLPDEQLTCILAPPYRSLRVMARVASSVQICKGIRSQRDLTSGCSSLFTYCEKYPTNTLP